jgi:hypothetical protein
MSTMVDAARRGPGPLRSPTEIDGGLFGAGRRLIHSHAVATDGLLAAGVLCLSTLWLVLSPFAGVGAACLQAGLIVPLIWRRSYPMLVFLVISALALTQWLLGDRLLGDVALLISLYTVAVHESRPRALLATGVLEVGAALAADRWVPAGTVPRSFLFLTATVVAALFAGLTVRSGSEYMGWLAERAERLEIERGQQKPLGAAIERARIAREMHDIVAHSLVGGRHPGRRRRRLSVSQIRRERPPKPCNRSPSSDARRSDGHATASSACFCRPPTPQDAELAPAPISRSARRSLRPGPGHRARRHRRAGGSTRFALGRPSSSRSTELCRKPSRTR